MDATRSPRWSSLLEAALPALEEARRAAGATTIEVLVGDGIGGWRIVASMGGDTDLASVRGERMASILRDAERLAGPEPWLPAGLETLRLELHSRDLGDAAIVPIAEHGRVVGYAAIGGRPGVAPRDDRVAELLDQVAALVTGATETPDDRALVGVAR